VLLQSLALQYGQTTSPPTILLRHAAKVLAPEAEFRDRRFALMLKPGRFFCMRLAVGGLNPTKSTIDLKYPNSF
jgi:hypothetical protein